MKLSKVFHGKKLRRFAVIDKNNQIFIETKNYFNCPISILLFLYRICKKSYSILKNMKIMYFKTIKTFLFYQYSKIKTIFHGESFFFILKVKI